MYNSSYPIRKKNASKTKYLIPWIKYSHIKCMDTKYRLFRRYEGGLVSFGYCNRYKNIVTTLLRRAKGHFEDRFNYSIDDPKKTCRLLNDLVNNGRLKNKKGISEIKVGYYMIENPAKVAEHFNSRYCSVNT